MKLFLIDSGDVTEINEPVQFDGETQVVAIAEDEDEAISLARDYDRGVLQYDNHIFDGRTVVAIKR